MLAHNGNGVGFEWLELEAHMNHLVFISHSSKDTEFAEKLRSKLSERGIKSWLDRDALDNDNWVRTYGIAITTSSCAV